MIELDEVVKDYRSFVPGRRSVRALDGVSMRVEAGEAVAVVGLNGAGKSTLMKALLGYIRPTSGSVRIGGLSPRDFVESRGIAYVPEMVAIPPKWTVLHALRTFAMLGDLPADAWKRVDQALERLGMTELSQRRVASLSKGNLQRVAIAQALLGERKILVLDEPTDALDPVWIAELRSIIADWREADPERVVVLASHTLPEVEKIADRTLLLHNGRIAGPLEAAPGGLEAAFLDSVRGLGEARA